MSPLRLIRRIHAPLAALAIACLVSAGCSVRHEVISLGEPTQAYQADSGEVVFGYFVQPTPRVTLEPTKYDNYAGWHWLVIDSATSKQVMMPSPPGTRDADKRTIAVTYQGWDRNARLMPPLAEPGLTDPSPPKIGRGGLTELRFSWDESLRAARVFDPTASGTLPMVRVTPESVTLRIREYNREAMLDVLKVAAVVGLVVGLILLGGSATISNN